MFPFLLSHVFHVSCVAYFIVSECQVVDRPIVLCRAVTYLAYQMYLSFTTLTRPLDSTHKRRTTILCPPTEDSISTTWPASPTRLRSPNHLNPKTRLSKWSTQHSSELIYRLSQLSTPVGSVNNKSSSCSVLLNLFRGHNPACRTISLCLFSFCSFLFCDLFFLCSWLLTLSLNLKWISLVLVTHTQSSTPESSLRKPQLWYKSI